MIDTKRHHAASPPRPRPTARRRHQRSPPPARSLDRRRRGDDRQHQQGHQRGHDPDHRRQRRRSASRPAPARRARSPTAARSSIDENLHPDRRRQGRRSRRTLRAGRAPLRHPHAPAGRSPATIANSGTITIEGNDSAPASRSAGRSPDHFTNSGTITVVGDRSVGIRAGDISGTVRLAGTIAASGEDAVGVSLDGDIGGALVVQGAIGATGYRSTTLAGRHVEARRRRSAPGRPGAAHRRQCRRRHHLRRPPPNNSTTDADEDKDGIEDAKEGTAAISSYRRGAAVQIGSATAPVTRRRGRRQPPTVTAWSSTARSPATASTPASTANGLVVGGLGGAVTIAGGMTVNGVGRARGPTARSATAIRIGSGASVPAIRVAGTIRASGGSRCAPTACAHRDRRRARPSPRSATAATIRPTRRRGRDRRRDLDQTRAASALVENGGRSPPAAPAGGAGNGDRDRSPRQQQRRDRAPDRRAPRARRAAASAATSCSAPATTCSTSPTARSPARRASAPAPTGWRCSGDARLRRRREFGAGNDRGAHRTPRASPASPISAAARTACRSAARRALRRHARQQRRARRQRRRRHASSVAEHGRGRARLA